jgi:hypothetical protein
MPCWINTRPRIATPLTNYAGTKMSPHDLAANTPAANMPTPVNMLMFPGSFSGAHTCSRTKRENADSFGSLMARRGGGAPNKAADWGGARRDMSLEFAILDFVGKMSEHENGALLPTRQLPVAFIAEFLMSTGVSTKYPNHYIHDEGSTLRRKSNKTFLLDHRLTFLLALE